MLEVGGNIHYPVYVMYTFRSTVVVHFFIKKSNKYNALNLNRSTLVVQL